MFKGIYHSKYVILLRKNDEPNRSTTPAICAMVFIQRKIALSFAKCFIGKLINDFRFIKVVQDVKASDDFTYDAMYA